MHDNAKDVQLIQALRHLSLASKPGGVLYLNCPIQPPLKLSPAAYIAPDFAQGSVLNGYNPCARACIRVELRN